MTFIIAKALEALQEQRQRASGENIFHESRLLQVTSLLSALHISDFHRRDTKANIYMDLSMFYFVICCAAFSPLSSEGMCSEHKKFYDLFAGIIFLSMK